MTDEVSLSTSPEAVARRKEKFLELLAITGGNVAKSARAVGYASTSAVRRWRDDDPVFARKWDEAIEASNDILEAHAIERATEGVEKAIFYQGEVIGSERIKSDGLLRDQLRARMPQKYAERKEIGVTGTVNHKVGVAVIPMLANSVEAWEQAAIAQAGSASPAPALPVPKKDEQPV